MNEPILTLITVTKNNAAGLRMTARSIEVQQMPPRFEWIIIDGASTDHTSEIIAQFADLNPKVISESDNSIYDAMNKGITASTGKYLWFLNAGDCLSDAYTLRDTAREIQYNMAPDFIYADARENGQVKKARSLSAFNWGQITHHQAMLYRRSVVADLRYDLDYPIAADYAFTLHMIARANKTHYFNRVICDFKGGGISHAHADQARLENFAIRRDLLRMNPLKNKFIYKMNEWAWKFRMRYPKLYKLLRFS